MRSGGSNGLFLSVLFLILLSLLCPFVFDLSDPSSPVVIALILGCMVIVKSL